MLTRDLNAMTWVEIVLRASAAGMAVATVGVVIYKLFGLSVLAAVLFAVSCGLIRAAWPRR